MHETESVFSCKAEDLSCLVGNLFQTIKPPCEFERNPHLTICGETVTGKPGRLVILGDRCLFFGDPADLAMVRNGVCIERRCERHG